MGKCDKNLNQIWIFCKLVLSQKPSLAERQEILSDFIIVKI